MVLDMVPDAYLGTRCASAHDRVSSIDAVRLSSFDAKRRFGHGFGGD